MFEIILAFFVIGSFTLGYSIARIALPKIQEEPKIKKTLIGYLVGAPIFLLPLLLHRALYFFLVIGLIVIFFIFSYILRIILKQNYDEIGVEKKKKKKKIQVKEKISTQTMIQKMKEGKIDEVLKNKNQKEKKEALRMLREAVKKNNKKGKDDFELDFGDLDTGDF